MEVTLIVVTLVSIALAIAMGILTWRLLQEERLRSDARVAALEQGLAETLQDAYVTQAAASQSASLSASRSPSRSIATTPAIADATSTSTSRSTSTSTFVASPTDAAPNDLFTRDDTDWLAHFPTSTAAPTASATGTSHDVAAHDVAAETVVNPNGGMFGQVEADDDSVGFSRHALAVAAVAAVMIGAVLAFWTIGRLMEPAADRPGAIAAGAGANGANVAVTQALELMSLSQAMQDGTLTISGLVRNPRAGVPQERLTAVVFFFDGQGGFLSSTRAPLDYRALAPGQESPFQLSAPAPPGVARYRVSFRRDEGAVVPHVDRRQQVQQSVHDQPDQRSEAARPDRHGQPDQPDQSEQPGQPRHDSPSRQQEASRS
jgi:hypothetical protein